MAEDHDRDHAHQRRRLGALAVAALLALDLLALSGTALAASVAGLAVAAPLLLLSSPVLAPAALLVTALTAADMAVSGSLAVGATGLLSHLGSAARRAATTPPDYVELGKRRVAEVAGEQTAQINPEQVARSRRPYSVSHALIS